MAIQASEEQQFQYVLRNSLSAFTQKVFHTVDPVTKYLHNWHIDAIAEYLMACEKGDIRRLIINIPPRTLKSICVSVAWPAWLLGHNPSEHIIDASYAQQLSNKLSVDCRLVVTSSWYREIFPDTALTKDQNEKSKFQTTERGHRIATSVGGTVTGEGGNFLILDDPNKPDEAMSEVVRKATNDWVDQTFMSRLNNKDGCVVVVQQRVHEDDVTGHLLAKGNWENLVLPAEFERKTIIEVGNKRWVCGMGELLHEDRMDKEYLAEKRIDLGSYAYAGQYQQKPSPSEGGMIKRVWLQYVDDMPRTFDKIIHSWDTAIKANTGNDYSALTAWGVRKNGFYLLHVVNKRIEYPELKQEVLRQADKDEPHAILIEDKGSGQSLIQDLRREAALPVIAINPIADKVSRMSAISALIESGNVFLPKHAAWLDEYVDQLLTFPNAKFDDMADSTSQFLNYAREKKLINQSTIDLSTIGGVRV